MGCSRIGRFALGPGLCFAALATSGSRWQAEDEPYQAALKETMHALDNGSMTARFESAWAKYEAKKTPANAVAAGMASMYAQFLCLHQLAPPPPEGVKITQAQVALRKAVAEEKNSAYPAAIYAWFVSIYREPGLPSPEMRHIGTTQIMVDGKPTQVDYDRVVADPAKKRRVAELLDKAEAIDPDNPLLKYMRGALAQNVTEKRRLIWGSLGAPGTRLWEFAAMHLLRRAAKADAAELARINERIKQAKAIVGDTPRAKGHGF